MWHRLVLLPVVLFCMIPVVTVPSWWRSNKVLTMQRIGINPTEEKNLKKEAEDMEGTLRGYYHGDGDGSELVSE